jgi:hypothetical protein
MKKSKAQNPKYSISELIQIPLNKLITNPLLAAG